MPVTLTVGMILQHRIGCQWGDQSGINVMHSIVQGTTLSGVTDAEVAAALDPGFAPLYKACLTNGAEYIGSGVKALFLIPPAAEVSVIANRGFGTGGADPLPLQSCGLISFRTPVAGRKGHGRIYVPFPSVTALTPGSVTFTGAYQTNLLNLGLFCVGPNTIVGAGGTATIIFGVLNRPTATLIAYTSAVQRHDVATQRRRSEFSSANAIFPS